MSIAKSDNIIRKKGSAAGASKKYVRSKKVKTDDLEPGMVLAEEVRLASGSVIITVDTELTETHINKLKDLSIDGAFIEQAEKVKNHDPLRGRTAVVVCSDLSCRNEIAQSLYKHNMLLCGEFDSVEAGIGAACRYNVDVFMLDTDTPGVSVGKVVSKLKRKKPDIRVVAISDYKERNHVVETLKSGADDFLVKPVNWDALRPRLLKFFTPAEEA